MAQQADVVETTVAAMAAWYSTHHVPEAFSRTDPRILKRVEEMVDGDWRRCATDDKGVSIVVYNRPVW